MQFAFLPNATVRKLCVNSDLQKVIALLYHTTFKMEIFFSNIKLIPQTFSLSQSASSIMIIGCSGSIVYEITTASLSLFVRTVVPTGYLAIEATKESTIFFS